VILIRKEKFLNIPFYAVRTFIYVIGASFFAWKLKAQSKKVDETKSKVEYQMLYRWAVGYIAFFGFASAAWAWDWLMSIDPHWYSTMYIWYSMVSCLSSGIAVIILLSVYLKKNGFLPQFNDNHLHDLGVFFSLQVCFGRIHGLLSSCFIGMQTFRKKLTISSEDSNTTLLLSYQCLSSTSYYHYWY
jgi:H+/Cl- antiporter ClcA